MNQKIEAIMEEITNLWEEDDMSLWQAYIVKQILEKHLKASEEIKKCKIYETCALRTHSYCNSCKENKWF